MTMTTLGKQQEKLNQLAKKSKLEKEKIEQKETAHLNIVETEELLKIFANYVNAN